MAIAAVRTGEALSEEFEELFREHWQLVYRTAYGITGNRQDAEDVLQSIFVKLLQRGISPELRHIPARYLHRAAVNLSLNVLRTRKRQKLVDGVEHLGIPDRAGDDIVSESDAFHDRLMDAIAQLKPRAVGILLLHYKHDYSDAQIAKLLGTSRGTIAVTLYRLRARLKSLLRSAGLPVGASAKAGSDGESMDSAEEALRELVDRHLPSPSHMEAVASHGRVLERLRSEPAHLQKPRIADVEPSVSRWSPAISAAAAAAVLAVAVGTAMFWPGGDAALYRVVDGTVQSGDTIRTNGGAGAMLALADGSRVEMRAQSELLLERAEDGVRIRLNRGGIIVNAATQRRGHLYVQTREMTVAVVGTVFLVNAAEDGSRVAVIEGEVRVREGGIERRLRPGEQVSTSPVLAARPLREEIAWSRHAGAHLAILESFTRGMAQTAGPLTPLVRQADVAAAQTPGAQAALEFEEASVRECDPDNLPPLPPGTRGGGANSVLSTPGRFYALCITPATLIRTAYGYRSAIVEALIPEPPRGRRGRGTGFGTVGSLGVEEGLRIRGGPDWVRNERYTIEAVASGTPDAATMSGPMLRALFARRFKLKTHVETEQTTAFNLVVAQGGLKIKPVASGACEMPVGKPGAPLLNGMPFPTPRSLAEVRRAAKPPCGISHGPNGPNWVTVGGEATFDALTQMLRGRLGRGIGVTDKTGITDKFNWDLESAVDANASALPSVLLTGAADANVPRAPTIFDALEEQLGLRLEPVQVPREYLVIDAIERPGAN